MDFLEFFLTFICSVIVINFLADVIIKVVYRQQKIRHEQNTKIVAEIMESIHMVRVEKLHGMDFWWDVANDEFLAQGHTTEEIIGKLKLRFPTDCFLVMASENTCFKLEAPEWKLTPVEVEA